MTFNELTPSSNIIIKSVISTPAIQAQEEAFEIESDNDGDDAYNGNNQQNNSSTDVLDNEQFDDRSTFDDMPTLDGPFDQSVDQADQTDDEFVDLLFKSNNNKFKIK